MISKNKMELTLLQQIIRITFMSFLIVTFVTTMITVLISLDITWDTTSVLLTFFSFSGLYFTFHAFAFKNEVMLKVINFFLITFLLILTGFVVFGSYMMIAPYL